MLIFENHESLLGFETNHVIIAEKLACVEREELESSMHLSLGKRLLVALVGIRVRLRCTFDSFIAEGRVEYRLAKRLHRLMKRALVGAYKLVELH